MTDEARIRPEISEAVAAIDVVSGEVRSLAERHGLTPFQVKVLTVLFEVERDIILDGAQDSYLADLAQEFEVPGSP